MMSRRPVTLLALALIGFLLAACSGRPPSAPTDLASTTPHGTYKLGSPYRINGVWYYPEFDPTYDNVGIASWYGRDFHGRPTANGEVFDMGLVSAAHPTMPMPSLVEVTNLENGRSIKLRVNDRGPFHDNREIDLSQAAARELGFENNGLAKVRVRFVGLLPANGTPPRPGTSTRPSAVVASTTAATQQMSQPKADRISSASLASGCGTVDAHFVQVAAVREVASARSLAADLATLGDVELAAAAQQLTRVRLGPYPSRRDAFGKLAQVRGLGYHDALVVSCS